MSSLGWTDSVTDTNQSIETEKSNSEPRVLKSRLGKSLDCFDGQVDQPQRKKYSEKESEVLLNADVLFSTGDYISAKKLYKYVVEENPYNELGLAGLGNTCVKLTDFEEAEKCFSTLIQIHPGFESYKLFGDYFYEIKNFEKAKSFYFATLEFSDSVTPLLFGVYKNLGNIFVQERDFEAAEEYYNKAFTIDDKSDALMVNYGTLELQKGNFDVALNKFREAVELNLANDKAWVGLALIHRQFGDKDLAWANIESALDFNSNNDTALKLAMEWAFLDDRTDSMISRLENYVLKNPQDTLMLFLLSKVLFLAGRFKQSNSVLQELLELDEDFEGVQLLKSSLNKELVRLEGNFND